MSFAQFEECLREVDSDVYCVALPKGYYGPDWEDRVRFPSEDMEGQPEYMLWAGVNGTEEAQEILQKLGVSPEENVERLRVTGVLTVESGS